MNGLIAKDLMLGITYQPLLPLPLHSPGFPQQLELEGLVYNYNEKRTLVRDRDLAPGLA